jgi:hypothetical protein
LTELKRIFVKIEVYNTAGWPPLNSANVSAASVFSKTHFPYIGNTVSVTNFSELLAISTQFLCHLDTGFSWFSWVIKQMLGWFPLFAFPSCHYMLPV